MPSYASLCILWLTLIMTNLLNAGGFSHVTSPISETREQRDARMRWWREARFGLFIHWGLYAIPAGAWGDKTHYGEWILDHARIPMDQYDLLRDRFHPVRFDADAWASLAAEAGCRYIIITTKHHDGFCLFDSRHTEWDVMATPFRRDIMKELADACRRADLRIGWYYSIMDWHHPDYLPRRPWEQRSTAGADYNRYVTYLHNQLHELLTGYGPIDVLWFDGQWEGTWTNAHSVETARRIRALQPEVILNSRIAKFSGFYGFDPQMAGVVDYGTPEQEIPAAAPAGIDWETCMTMNNHWGYNAGDRDFKSARELIRKLADIVSKGGNFLLNVGPDANGEIPPESVERLKQIGAWMRVHGESIYATQADPGITPAWGRCTQKDLPGGGTRLYLHVFDWPVDGWLRVERLLNERVAGCHLLADGARQPLETQYADDTRKIKLPAHMPDSTNTVVVLDLPDPPDVAVEPTIQAPMYQFIDSLRVSVTTAQHNIELRITMDGSDPVAESPLATAPIVLTDTTKLAVRGFRNQRPVTPIARAEFRKVAPRAADTSPGELQPGMHYQCFEGEFERLPDFAALNPTRSGACSNLDRTIATREDRFAIRYDGYIRIPRGDVYQFTLASDDGSRLYIGDTLLIDHDGLHSLSEKTAEIALAAGFHRFRVHFFEATGGHELIVTMRTADGAPSAVSDAMLFRTMTPQWSD